MGYRDYSTAKGHIVDTTGYGDFTTIGAALTAASSGQTIFIRPGTYTENLTLVAGVNLTAYTTDANNGTVTIIGTLTATYTGVVNINGIRLQTNSANVISSTGSNTLTLNLFACYLNCTNNTGIACSNANATISFYRGNGDLGTTGISFHNISAGNLAFFEATFTNSGSSLTANTASGGRLGYEYCLVANQISTTSTGGLGIEYTRVSVGSLNTTALTHNGTGANSYCNYCEFDSGTASAVSIGVGATLAMLYCAVNSSNTNAITGSGAASLTQIIFSGTSKGNNVTTTTYLPIGPTIYPAGLTFDATNVMSTYKIGTFTPGVAFGGAAVGITYTYQAGYYTQIGDVISITGYILLTSKGSSSGVATLTGLPITTGANGDFFVIPITYFQNITVTATALALQLVNNATTAQIFFSTSGTTLTQLSNTNFSNSGSFAFNGWYKVV
jgi:hypothetical protein